MKIIVIYVALIYTVVSFQVLPISGSDNPGFRAILTTKGLNYVHSVGLSLLKDWLCHYKIPTIIESYSPQGKDIPVNYTFSNVTIHSLNFGNSYLTSDMRGVVLTVRGISLSVSGNWAYEEAEWPYLMDNGSGNASFHGVSLSLSTDVLANETTGHFQLNTTSCSFSVDAIDIIFGGGSSFIYNLFGPALQDLLISFLNDKGCNRLTEWINTQGNEYVEALPVVLNVTDGVEIDYGLVSNANFAQKGRVVTDHKGEFLLSANPQDPPFNPPPLPDPSADHFNESKMVYVIATTYVAESASYAFWKTGLLVYNVSNKKIPPLYQMTSSYCFSGLVSKELCTKYPKKKVSFHIAASDCPRLNVTEDYAAMSADASLSMYVDNNGTEELAFVLALNLTADVKPFLRRSSSTGQYFVCANVSNPKVEVSLAQTNIGKFNCSRLQKTINVLAPLFGLPYINKYTNAGAPIPMLDKRVYFTSPSLKLGKGYVVVGSDLLYKKTTSSSCDYN